MFKRSKKSVENQIPAELFVSIHAPQARRKRWLIEIAISLLIVVGLLVGGMLVYKKFHQTNEPSSVPKSNAERVTQPPQSNDPQEDASEPADTPGSGITNEGAVPQPE